MLHRRNQRSRSREKSIQHFMWFCFDFYVIGWISIPSLLLLLICYWCCRNYLFTPHNSHITEIVLRCAQLCIRCICAHHSFQLLHCQTFHKSFFPSFPPLYTAYFLLLLSLSHQINPKNKKSEKIFRRSIEHDREISWNNHMIKRTVRCLRQTS